MMQFMPTRRQQESRTAKRKFEANEDMYRMRAKLHSFETMHAWGQLDAKGEAQLEKIRKEFDEKYGKAE